MHRGIIQSYTVSVIMYYSYYIIIWVKHSPASPSEGLPTIVLIDTFKITQRGHTDTCTLMGYSDNLPCGRNFWYYRTGQTPITQYNELIYYLFCDQITITMIPRWVVYNNTIYPVGLCFEFWLCKWHFVTFTQTEPKSRNIQLPQNNKWTFIATFSPWSPPYNPTY